MTDETTKAEHAGPEVAWDPPGPGHWELDLSHCLGSMTPTMQYIQATGIRSGMRELFALYGMPADTLDGRFVNGYFFTRLRPLLRPDKPPKKAPPAFVLKLAFKLHPELRRRAKRAERTLAEQPWRAAIRHWESTERAEFETENLAFQDTDVTTLDDAALAEHHRQLFAATLQGYHRHFVLHGYDLGPIGILLVEAQRWGIDASDIVPALQGASQSTSEPARILSRLRATVAAGGAMPATLDDVRALSSEASAELDAYLRYRGMLVFSRYDVDGVTLAEMPGVVLASILDGREAKGTHDPEAEAAALRERVPAEDRAIFDDLLREARFAMNLRDDNGPTTAEWRMGLLRRALLETGRRLHDRGRIAAVEDVFELTPEEVAPTLAGAATPTAGELSARAERRRSLSTLAPPATLGAVEPEPPAAALPKATATLLGAVRLVLDQLASQPKTDGLSGTGVGTVPYRGRVRRAFNPEEAVATLEPGEVLVVPFTTPAYNVVLPLAGAIVTAEGGPLCHAAVLARELGLAAVVGAASALTDLHDGMEVEVDPVAGRVQVLAQEPAPLG
jgi:pyruvate,water dikinase